MKGRFCWIPTWALALLLAEQGCSRDPFPLPAGVVTRVELTFTEGAQSATYIWNDRPQPGAPIPRADQIELRAGRSYSCRLRMWDASIPDAPRDLTDRIRRQKTDYLVCYQPSAGLPLAVAINDLDDKALPVGLNTGWQAGAVSAGGIGIRIQYAPGAKRDDCALPVEVESVFPVRISP